MAIVLLSSKTSVLVKSFESPFLRFLGKYSYGMYVAQLPLVTLMPLTAWFGLLPSNPLVQSLLYVVGMFGLIATIAVLSFHCVERPFLRIKQRFE